MTGSYTAWRRNTRVSDYSVHDRCDAHVSAGKVIQNIHILMWDADNIDPILAQDIEYQVRPLRKAIIAYLYIGAMLSQARVLRQPGKPLIKVSQVNITFFLAPNFERIAPDIF